VAELRRSGQTTAYRIKKGGGIGVLFRNKKNIYTNIGASLFLFNILKSKKRLIKQMATGRQT